MESKKIYTAIGILVVSGAAIGGVLWYYNKKQKQLSNTDLPVYDAQEDKASTVIGNTPSATIRVDNTPVVVRESSGIGKRNAGVVQKSVMTGMDGIKNLIAQQ